VGVTHNEAHRHGQEHRDGDGLVCPRVGKPLVAEKKSGQSESSAHRQLVVVLLGLFTDSYAFMLGLVIAIGMIWSVSGLFTRYWDVPKWKARQD